MSDDEQIKVVLNDRANLSSDRHKLLRIGAKQVSYMYAKATGTITRGTISFDAVDLPDLGNSVISRNMRVRYQVKITAGAGQLGMFNPNVSMDTGVGELHLPYGALRPFPLSTCTNACTVSINGSSNTVRLRDVMSAVTRTIPQEYLEKEATEGPSQLDNAWVLVSDNTIGTGAYMATSAQPLSSCYNCPNGTSRASFAPLSYVESGPLGDEAIFEVTEPILCSPMTLSAEETWLANVNVLSVLYVYSNLGDMCVYGAVTTDAGSVLPVYPPNYNVELVEGSARLIFGIATVDNEVIVIPPVVNYPFSKPDLHTTHLKPWVAPMSDGEVQNTGTVVSETIRLTYTPSLIYIYAQLPVNIRAENAVATEYPYPDVFYSLGSASGTTLAGLTYDTSQNILSIRWNRREGFLTGATIKDLYRVSVSNGYQSSFNDWLASPIIIINPVKDMGIDFSNDTYADMAGHNSLTVSCSFNTYNLLTRTAQVLGSQAPAEIGEFYSYLNTHVGAEPADANLLKMVNNVLQPLASFQMRDALNRLRPENTYVFYDPIDNVFFACGHTRKSLFMYAGLGATLGTLLDELVIDAIVSATYFEGRVTVCHARVAPFTDATEVSFYRSINNQLVQVEGATITHDAQGNPFTNITSASQDADNVVIANVLDISVFSRTGPQTYWYPIDPDAVAPAGMLHAPARKMLGAGAGVPQTARFVAGGNVGQYGGSIAYSDDGGVTWTAGSISSIFTGGVNAIAYGNGIWVAVGYNSAESHNGMIASSPDGINWAVSSSGETILGETNGVNVIFGGGIFVVAGEDPNLGTNTNIICTSIDGITWTLESISYSGIVGGIAFGAETFVVGLLSNDLIIGSESGGIWGWSISGHPVPSGGVMCIAYRAMTSQWYVGGQGEATSTFYYSADLVTWTEDTLAEGLMGNSPPTSMVYGNGVLIAGTENNPLIIVLYQTGTWSLDNLPAGVDTRQLAYGTSWVVVGSGIAHSGNGTNWTLATNPDILTTAFCVAYGDVLTFNSEYYAYGDGNLHVKLYRGTVNPVDLNPVLVLEYDTATEILSAWYDPFTKLLWATDGSYIYIYNDAGAVLVTYQLPLQMGPCNFYSSRTGPLLAISAFSAPCTVYVYQLQDLVSIVQYGNTISLDFAGNPLGTVSAVAISANNVVISHTTLNQATIISTYTYSNGQYQATNDFTYTPNVTVLGQALDTNTAIYNATTTTGPYIICSPDDVTYYNLVTNTHIINGYAKNISSIACFADYTFSATNGLQPLYYNGNISTVTLSTDWITYAGITSNIINITHFIVGDTELILGLQQFNDTDNMYAITCALPDPTAPAYNSVSPTVYLTEADYVISVDAVGYIWITSIQQPPLKADQLPTILPVSPYLNWSTITFSTPTFTLDGTPTHVADVSFDTMGVLYALTTNAIYSTEIVSGIYVMTYFCPPPAIQPIYPYLYIPPSVATTGQTGVVSNNINKMDYTTGSVLASQNVDVNPNSGIMYDETSGQLRNLIAPIVGFLDTTTLVQQNSITLVNSQEGAGVGYTTDAIITYTVTYSLNGASGTPPTQNPQVAGQRFILASAPTRAGYTFDGWLDSFSSNVLNEGTWYTMPAENITLTAQWTLIPPTYTVTYLLNGATGTAPTQSPQVAGATFTLAPAPNIVGYSFQGWLDSFSSTLFSAGAQYTMPAQAVTFTAQWTYTITYALNGGTPQSPPQIVTPLQAFALPIAPSKETFTFQGWQLGTQVFPASHMYTMPSAPSASPLTFTAVWTPPPPVPPTPPAPPATMNQYYSFVGRYEVTATGYLYSSIGSAPLTTPTLEFSFPLLNGAGSPVVGLGLFYDPIEPSYWLVTESHVYLYNVTGQYVAESIAYNNLAVSSFFPSTPTTAGKLVVCTIGPNAVAYVFSQRSGNVIVATGPITNNYAGATFTELNAGACDNNSLVLVDGNVATVYSSEPTGYTALWDLPLSGIDDVGSISVDEPYDTLYACGSSAQGGFVVNSYNLSTGYLIATASTTGILTMVFDQATSQLRSMEASSTIGFLDVSTLTSLFTASLAPHGPESFGYSTSPTIVPPVPPVEPKYEYFSFINTSQAYLYEMLIDAGPPPIEPTLVTTFVPLDVNGNPLIATNLFYDALNQRFWAVNDQYIYVYHRNHVYMTSVNVTGITNATFYPATAVGHSPQVVISTENDYVQLWKTVGTALVSVSVFNTTRIGLQCASRDATNLIMGFSGPAGADIYDVATTSIIYSYNFTEVQEVVISTTINSGSDRFYTAVERPSGGYQAQEYNLTTGALLNILNGGFQYYNIIYDTLSERIMLANDNLPYNVFSLETKGGLGINRTYTFDPIISQSIGYSTSNTDPPVLESTITYDLNGASGSFPFATWPDGQPFVVEGYGTPPAGFNFLYWFFGTSTIGIGGYTWWPMPTGGGALVAQWTYDITYAMAGGTSPTPTQTPVSANTSFIVAPTPTRPDHTFDGWTDGTTVYQAGSTYTMPVAPTAQPVTLTATWSATITYTVTYSLTTVEFGGPPDPPPTQAPQEAGAIFNVATFTPPTGYTFGRWTDSYYGSTYAMGDPYTMPAEDVTIDAVQWLISVTYFLNGGIAPAPTQVPVGIDDEFPIGFAVSRVGYSFAGWSDGTSTYQPTAIYTVQSIDQILSLTAQWTLIPSSYSVASLSVDSVNNQFYCVIDEYSGAGAFMSSMIQRRQITNGDLSATVTSGGLVYNIIYDYTSNQLVTASSLRPQNVDKLNVDTLAENTAYIVPCDYLGFTTSVAPPIVQDWATLPNLDLQIVCVEEGICQISPDFFRINTACMSMAEVKEAIDTASQDGSFIPQSLDDSPRTLFGGQRAVISGTARGYDGDDDEESINSE